MDFDRIFKEQSKSVMKSLVVGGVAAASVYLLMESGLNYNIAGFAIPAPVGIGLLAGGSVYIQDSVRDTLLPMIGIDNNSLVNKLGYLAEPTLTAASVIGINIIVALINGNLSDFTYESFVYPGALGFGSDLVGGYLEAAM